MKKPTYHMTPTAEDHFWKALSESTQIWGEARAEKYRVDFLKGLQSLAENHRSLKTPHRAALARGTAFSVHLVEHRYVAFQAHDKATIIIAGIFHRNMDIPARLKELQGMTQHEINALKHQIRRVRAGGG